MQFYTKLNRIQSKAQKQILASLKKNGKALLVSATGTGKTEIAAKTIKTIQTEGKILWITHQNELVEQVFQRLADKFNLDVSVFNGEFKDLSGNIVIASVQSLSRPATLKSIPRKTFKYVIFDECHHAPAMTWQSIISHFKAQLIGMTATHIRPDGLSVTDIFGKPVFELYFEDAQKKGFLSKDKNRIILTNSVIDGHVQKNKDYTNRQLEKLYTSTERNEIIVKSYLKYGRKEVKAAGMKPKAVCFCISIEHAKRMKDLFNSNGISSELICSNSRFQNKKERNSVMERFRYTNEIEILCAVNIFNEGVDIPEANIGIMTRPTRSNILYQQQVGRIARPDSGNKSFFVVLDFVDNTRREYTGYILGNLKKSGITHSSVVMDFVNEPDPVVVNTRVEELMKSVRKFEQLVNLEITKENAMMHLEALARGKKLQIAVSL